MTPTYTYTLSGAFERDDIELVKMFLSQFKDNDGRTYALKARPDVEERKAKAVEAIALAEDGRTLAVEHTYIQPFEGQKSDDVPFLTVFEQLRKDLHSEFPTDSLMCSYQRSRSKRELIGMMSLRRCVSGLWTRPANSLLKGNQIFYSRVRV